MKKTKLLCALSTLLLLTGCGEHEITYMQRWEKDDPAGHYHLANCCDEHRQTVKSEVIPHSFGDVITDATGTYRMCSVCYYKDYNPGTNPGGGGGSGTEIGVDANGFTNVTKFDDTVEIHTEAQKTYLAYSGEYLKMPQSSYPDGNKTNSNPVQMANQDVAANPATVTWDYADHTDTTVYSVDISTKADFSDGFTINGTNAKSINLYNLYLGDNYYRINAFDDDETTTSGVYKLTVDSTYPRNLYVGVKMTNCRDMGGRVTKSGATIKQGLIYRTCGNGYNQDGQKIDEEGKDILLNQLKVKSEIVLHNDDGFNFNLEGTKVYKTYMDYKNGTNTKHHFSRNTENVKNVFEILAKEESYPTYYHCRIGTDRTGLIAILVNGVLGVSINEIYQDYLFSNFGKIGSKRKIGAGDEDDITNYMNEIANMPGADFQEKVYNTLITIGVPAATIAKVQDILLDGEKPNNSNGQVVVSAKNMTLAGTTLKTEAKTNLTERNNPAAYFTLSKDATATFDFDGEGSKELWMYVGNEDQSESKKFNASMSVTVDGSAVTVSSMDFKTAGMGNYRNRVNYYFVKIGNVSSLSAGSHTVVVKGLANNLIIGNISVL